MDIALILDRIRPKADWGTAITYDDLKRTWRDEKQKIPTIEELEQAFFRSRSTIKRRINKLKLFLSAFQLNLSFQYKPILSGSEFNLRLLALIVDLINDPPFDFHSKEELIQRIESIQEKRISVGCSFNQLPFAQLFAKEDRPDRQAVLCL